MEIVLDIEDYTVPVSAVPIVVDQVEQRYGNMRVDSALCRLWIVMLDSCVKITRPKVDNYIYDR